MEGRHLLELDQPEVIQTAQVLVPKEESSFTGTDKVAATGRSTTRRCAPVWNKGL